MAMEKSRDYYKDQWWKASQQVQKLNTKLLRMQELEYCRKGGVNCVTYKYVFPLPFSLPIHLCSHLSL